MRIAMSAKKKRSLIAAIPMVVSAKKKRSLFAAILMMVTAMCAQASAPTDSIAGKAADVVQERESMFPQGSRSLAGSHFTWGAEAGASIDLTGHDMSTFDADVLIGYKSQFIRLVGIGAGIHRAFGNGNNFVPIYAVFRSSFRKKPSLFFMHLDFGYSFNTLGDSPTFGDWMGSLGCGINLAMSRRFQSHIIMALGFRHFNERHRNETSLDVKDVYIARIGFGVNF